MNDGAQNIGFLRELTWSDIVFVVLVLVGCQLLVLAVRRIVQHKAENSASRLRLLILRMAPVARLLIWIVAAAVTIPMLVEPSFGNVVALLATAGLALAFALKDYASCVVAGIVTIVENTYQPGDWIEVNGVYGEVTAIGSRAVHIVTTDDTEVIIPHVKIWTSSLSNASGGKRSLLCVTYFYLDADHDGAAVRGVLIDVGETSGYRKPQTPVKVTVAETPWGTRYKIKAYVLESREQFAMISDLTIRGKERLRAMGVTFAQAPYAEGRTG